MKSLHMLNSVPGLAFVYASYQIPMAVFFIVGLYVRHPARL